MYLIAFLGGLLTVLSPCILPVVPFLFANADRKRSSILLTLGGMTLTFALISSLAVVSSEWVIQASNTGRHIALIVMALFALSLISARVGDWLARPFVLLGNRLDPDANKKAGPMGSVMIGVATGLSASAVRSRSAPKGRARAPCRASWKARSSAWRGTSSCAWPARAGRTRACTRWARARISTYRGW